MPPNRDTRVILRTMGTSIRFSAVTVTVAILALAGCATFTSAPPAKTFIVFFAPDSDNLMPDSKASVRQAAKAIKLLHPSVVMVAGEPKTPI